MFLMGMVAGAVTLVVVLTLLASMFYDEEDEDENV